jgi:beta-glucosidase
MLKFPNGFLWGAATSAHQVEGGNVSSDFWALENATPSFFVERSGDAIDHYHRFRDDIALLAALGLGAYRFSIEWARIEPEEGHFSAAVLSRYQRYIDACLEHGVAPIVTFQHFTLPLWQARRGGFTDAGFADRFARFCDRAAGALRGFHTACTLNELNLPILFRDQYLIEHSGHAAECRRAAEAILGGSLANTFLFTPAEAILTHGLEAHRKARAAIKDHHPSVQVGVTLAIQDEQAEPGAEKLRDERRKRFYDGCLEAVAGEDFIGVQAYTRVVARKDGSVGPEPGHPISVMGYEDRPQALGEACRYVWERTRTPLIVTENGWAGDDDRRRVAFIREAVIGLHGAMSDGADVRGYFYWSLFDNFEWLAGYAPKFGLIAVDRATQSRRVKPSAIAFGEIARLNGLPGNAARRRH